MIEQTNTNHQSPIQVAVVGAAGKKGGHFLEELLSREDVKVTAVLVNNTVNERLLLLADQHDFALVKGGNPESLQVHDFEVVVIAVPHGVQDGLIRHFLELDKRIIIEKGDMKAKNIQDYQEMSKANNKPIVTTYQRNTMEQYSEVQSKLHLIGSPKTFNYTWTFNFPTPTSGWRANPKLALGGVSRDMGSHIIDLMILLFGKPAEVESELGYHFKIMEENKLDDYANIEMAFESGVKGNILLDRHAESAEEVFTIQGTEGSITIDSTGFQIKNYEGEMVEEVAIPYSRPTAIKRMFDRAFAYRDQSVENELWNAFEKNLQTVEVIETVYHSWG